MNRKFNIGDRVICRETGVTGKVLKFYIPTACEEQTMVLTDSGRRYHAPTRMWGKCGMPQSPLESKMDDGIRSMKESVKSLESKMDDGIRSMKESVENANNTIAEVFVNIDSMRQTASIFNKLDTTLLMKGNNE